VGRGWATVCGFECSAAALQATVPCGAQSHGLVANSLRELRSLRSNSRDEIRSRGVLRTLAMCLALLGAA